MAISSVGSYTNSYENLYTYKALFFMSKKF